VNIIESPDEEWKKKLAIYNYSRARWIIAVSNYVRDEISRYSTNSTVIEVIPNGVDTESFKPVDKKSIRTKLNLSLEDTYLFYSGNLIKRKGVDILLSAFAQLHEKHPHLRCLIAGKGPEGVSLHKLANQLGIRSKVDFIGFIPISDMHSWYQASDVFIMPSSSEGLSLSVLEALSCGLPVITSKPFIGGHDAVIPGETGLLTPFGNINNLMKAIETLISSSHRRQEMSHNARCLAKQKFDWKIIAKSTADFYHRILTKSY
jgi:glycosyltransferase involved in cell wall biosynthesis